MRRFEGHNGIVRAVAFLPDGRLVSAGDDKTVRLWDRDTGESTQLVTALNPVYALAVSPDGKTLAFAGRHPRGGNHPTPVHLWDLTSGQPAGEHKLPVAQFPRSVWSLSFSADGSILAAAGRCLGAANITAGAGGHWWSKGSDGPIASATAFSLAFAPTGLTLVVAANANVGFYPNANAVSPDVTHKLAAARPEAVAILPSGEAVVAAGTYLCIASPQPKMKPRKVKTGSRVLTSVAAFPSGRSVVAGGKPGAVEVFDVATGTARAAYDFNIGAVHGVAVAPDGLTFAVAGEHGLAVCDADGW